jgi:hypothetical protein
MLAAEAGLQERVRVVRVAVLRRILRGSERLDRPPLEQPLELARLARVARREDRFQMSLQ